MRTGATSKFCSDIQDLCNGASSIRCYGSIERFRHQLSKCLDCITECNFVEQNVSAWIRTVLCILSNTAMLVFIIVGVLMANEGMISMGLLALIVNSSFTVLDIY
jgi:ABC-type transport system involved in cytochrome bd biosynthesis fused ATPase/permease subunit